jgi:hypothetical protein
MYTGYILNDLRDRSCRDDSRGATVSGARFPALERAQKIKRIGVAAGVAIAAVLAYGGYAAYETRELRGRVTGAIATASDRLGETLAIDINAPAAGLAERLAASVAQTEAALQSLRAPGARRDPALVEAADGYVTSALEVLRRQAGATRFRSRFIDDRSALEAHMTAVGSRSESWAAEAIRLRKRLDEDYFGYQLASASLGNMLAGLVDARGKLLVQLPSAKVLAETAIGEARERSLAAAAAAKLELERARRLPGPA